MTTHEQNLSRSQAVSDERLAQRTGHVTREQIAELWQHVSQLRSFGPEHQHTYGSVQAAQNAQTMRYSAELEARLNRT